MEMTLRGTYGGIFIEVAARPLRIVLMLTTRPHKDVAMVTLLALLTLNAANLCDSFERKSCRT